MPPPINTTQPHFTRDTVRAKNEPKPLEDLAKTFGDGLARVGEAVATGGAPLVSAMLPALGGVLGQIGCPLSGGLGGGLLGGSGVSQQMQLLEMQRKIQNEAQVYQAASNILKTDHDSKMNAVRNIRP